MSESSVTSSKPIPLFTTLGAVSALSLTVLAVVGRQSYKRKVVQLTKQIAEETAQMRKSEGPPRVWAVLSPSETLKVFFVPMVWVLAGTGTVGIGLKKWYGVRDWDHAVRTMKWVAGTGPPS
jgi:hypothetical protein